MMPHQAPSAPRAARPLLSSPAASGRGAADRARQAGRPRRRLAAALAALTALTALGVACAGCASELPGDPPELDRLEFPVGMAIHPSGRYLYVVNANFDLRYRIQDGGSIAVIDAEAMTLLPERGRELASFGSEVVLNADATRGYVAVRGDSSVTWFELSEDGATLGCPRATGGQDEGLEACRHVVAAEPTGLAYARASRTVRALDADGLPAVDEDGEPVVRTIDYDLLGVAHLSEGVVSAVTVSDPQAPSTSPFFQSVAATLLDAPSDVVADPTSSERFFVTGRAADAVIGVRPAIGPDAEVLGLFQDTALLVPTPFSSYQGRSLLFSRDGRRLYVTNQSPNALLIFDTDGVRLDADDLDDRVIATLDMPREPNRMAWVDEADGTPLLYVTCFGDDAIAIVDPELPAIIGRLPLGDGPYDIVVDPSTGQRAFVTNFTEHTVSVLDLTDPRQPVEAGIIAGDADLEDARAFREHNL